jgi:hypothetical protein
MLTSFLLRFQESCATEGESDAHCGTKTETKILREDGGDADVQAADFRALSRSASETATATKTWTFVRGEVSDEDPGKAALQALPRLATLAHRITKTATAVKAEMDDRDAVPRYLNTIPRCS